MARVSGRTAGCPRCGAPLPADPSQWAHRRRWCSLACREAHKNDRRRDRRAAGLEAVKGQAVEKLGHAERAVVAAAGPVDAGPHAAFDTPTTAYREAADGRVLAVMPRVPFDGTQACLGDDRFIDDHAQADAAVRADLAAICGGCRWFTPCRDWAVAHERHGFIAGLTGPGLRAERASRGVMLVERLYAHLYGLAPEPATYRGEDADDEVA